jgi:5-methylcytosine-specific restriction endonuclease McrA
MAKYTDSLRGYGAPVFERDGWVCRYCGFDGRRFGNWLFLTVDHMVPISQGGSRDPSNLVTCCRACNSFFNRGEVQSFEQKKAAIAKRREEFRAFWEEHVRPKRRA